MAAACVLYIILLSCLLPYPDLKAQYTTRSSVPAVATTKQPACVSTNLADTNGIEYPSGTVIGGRIATAEGDGVNAVTVMFDGHNCTLSSSNSYSTAVLTSGDARPGTYTCTCGTCRHFTVTPTYDVNPLNGVSTYDLVLISKHILGLEALNTPYKMIAADANMSGSITTFDIVELRKLILGIYTKLPNNSSWRFVPRDYVFPNLQNPFMPAFPEKGIINPLGTSPVYENDFVAIKVGDLDKSVIARPAVERPAVPLAWDNAPLRAGEIITVPIVHRGGQALDAIQLGLRFDPGVLALISPSKGDLPMYRADNFNLSEAASGKIRTLWLGNLAEEERIEPGAVLFHLSFRVLKAVPESALPLWLDDEVLQNAAWLPDGTECALSREPASDRSLATTSPATAALSAVARPNPTQSEAVLMVQAPAAAKGKVVLYGAYGKRLAAREVVLTLGTQDIALPELAQLPAGVYLWKVEAAGQRAQGHIVKQ